jgi:serine/threonine protein phosphatase PrpC
MPSPEEFACTCDTGLGWAFGCSRTGASHIRTGKPCEDAYALWSGSAGAVPCIAVAVADGHGDDRHDQSRTGSALAVEAAITELVGFHRMYAEGIPTQRFRADFRTDFPRRITRRWRDLVLLDAEVRALPPKNDQPDRSRQDVLFTRYGTTLLTALIARDSIVVGQVGDGDILMVRPDGAIEFPLTRDTTLTGNETRSLSSADAHLLWRTATFDRGDGGVLIAATDGVSDSFDGSESEEFRVFIRSLVERIHTFGMQSVAGAMSSWLDRYSSIASGDDMTLVYICVNPEGNYSGNIQDPAPDPVEQKTAVDEDNVLAWEGW